MIPNTPAHPPARPDDRGGPDRDPAGLATAAVIAVVVLVVAAPLVPGLVAADHGEDGDAPSVPASYYGDVTVNGDPAEAGTEITAIVNGEPHGSIEISEAGSYGGPGALDEKLVVEGAQSGDTVSFEVRGVEAKETVEWESGDVQEVNLTFEDAPQSDDNDDGSDGSTEEDDASGGGGAAPAPPESTEQPTDSTEQPATPDGETTLGPNEEIDSVEDVSGIEIVDQTEADISTGSGTDTPEATFDSGVPVQEIEFESISGGSGTQTEAGSGPDPSTTGSVEVTEISEPPAETGDPPGSTTAVTDIQVPDELADQSATVEMRVSDDRLAELDATAETMRIHRYSDGEWQALETSVAEETESGVVIEADTPGFSFFAASAVGEPDAEVSLSADTVDPNMPVTLNGTSSDAPYGEIVAYNWSVAGQELTGDTASLALEEPGEYTVELVVVNGAGETDTETATLVVSNPVSDGDGKTAAVADGGDAGSANTVARETLAGIPSVWILGAGAVFVAAVLGLTVVLRREDSSRERL